MLVVCISDLHLGQPFALGQFKDFLADLRKRVRPDILVLAGDILELAWMQWEDLKKQKLATDALDELKAFATGIETVYLPGNHDPYPAIPKDEVSPIHVVAPPVDGPAFLERNGVIYTHGHQFDVTTHFWDAILKMFLQGFPLQPLLPSLYVKLYGTPYEMKTARRQLEFNEYVGWIMGRGISTAIRDGKDLCFGHTHSAMAIDLGGRVIVNSGDWRTDLTWVEVKDGKMALRWWR